MVGHYLLTDPPTEIEFKETDRNTGRQARVVRTVPRHLDPKDPGDHNYPGEIIVSNGENAQARDIIFLGEPTVDMEPVDEEARQITKSMEAAGKWTRPAEGQDFGESLIKNFMEKLDRVAIQPVSTSGIDPKAFADLQAQVAALVAQNAALQAKIAETPTRRSVK